MAKPTTSYAVGGQVAARRPGNEPVTPARRNVRGRAKAVRSSTTTAHLSGGAVSRLGSLFDVEAWRACAKRPSPAPCANSPCPSQKRAGRARRFVGRSTTDRAPRSGFSRSGQLVKPGSTRRSSTEVNHRGRAWVGGWDVGAGLAANGGSLSPTRHGSDRGSRGSRLEVIFKPWMRERLG